MKPIVLMNVMSDEALLRLLRRESTFPDVLPFSLEIWLNSQDQDALHMIEMR